MSPATDTLGESVPIQQWTPESPFLAGPSRESEAAGAQGETTGEAGGSASLLTIESPFRSEYLLGDEVVDREGDAVREMLGELLDNEFDEAMEDLLSEAEAEVERLGLEESPAGVDRAERHLEQWIAPLRLEAEALLERMASALDTERVELLSEDRLDQLLDPLEPSETGESPAFEGFLGKLWRKAKAAVRGAVNLAKKGISAVSKILPIGAILRKLSRLVRPLLRRVVTFAINRLPPALRPYAAKLARRFTGEAELLEEGMAPASFDVRSLQLDFDTSVAGLLLAPSELEEQELLDEVTAASAGEEPHVQRQFDEARDQFVASLQQLQEGQDPTPLVEEFIPAILPVLRIGIRIVGRSRVVRFLAGYLGRLIGPYVGPQITPALSQAIVDAGLRLITLETPGEASPQEASPQLAAEAFANVVEDAVRRLSEMSEEELEDERSLEEATYEAFQQAVAENIPATLLDPNSEYLETRRPIGTWIGMPRGRRPRYRKYSRVFRVTITPQAARAIRTFGGRRLSDILRHRLGRAGVVRAKLHLYQAIPGTRIARIARWERSVRGLGTGRRLVREQFHPLTAEAAGMLIGEPGLGRELDEASLEASENLAVGDRLYFLEIPGPAPSARRASDASVAIDLRANELRMAIFLAESDAQQIATRLRRGEPLGATLVALRRIYRTALRSALSRPRSRVRIIREQPEQEEFFGKILRLGQGPMALLSRAISRWTSRILARELRRQSQAFVTATAAAADGVTLLVQIQAPPGLRILGSLLGGRPIAALQGIGSITQLRGMLGGAPSGTVRIQPGYRRA
jgi:hypothetical protein